VQLIPARPELGIACMRELARDLWASRLWFEQQALRIGISFDELLFPRDVDPELHLIRGNVRRGVGDGDRLDHSKWQLRVFRDRRISRILVRFDKHVGLPEAIAQRFDRVTMIVGPFTGRGEDNGESAVRRVG